MARGSAGTRVPGGDVVSVPVGPDMRTPDGAVHLRRVQPLPERVRAHPLATQQGVDLLLRMVAADDQWRPLTVRQQSALFDAYVAALYSASAAGGGEEVALPLPALLAGVHGRTVSSLERRGLVAGGALTPLAVEVVSLVPHQPNKRRQMKTFPLANGEYL